MAHNPRSTVGTITEVYDFYRLFFLSLGTRICPHEGTPMIKKTHKDVIQYLSKSKNGLKIGICAQIRKTFETPEELRDFVGQKGFVRYLSSNRVYNLSDALPEKISEPWIIVDRVELDSEDATQNDRLSQSISTAFEHGEEVVGIYNFEKESMEIFSRAFRCPLC